MVEVHSFETYVRLRRLFFSLLPCGFAAIAMGGFGSFLLPASVGFILGFVGVVAFVMVWITSAITWIRILLWPCPRCSKSFVFSWWSTWPTDQCKNCGLRINDREHEIAIPRQTDGCETNQPIGGYSHKRTMP